MGGPDGIDQQKQQYQACSQIAEGKVKLRNILPVDHKDQDLGDKIEAESGQEPQTVPVNMIPELSPLETKAQERQSQQQSRAKVVGPGCQYIEREEWTNGKYRNPWQVSVIPVFNLR